MIKSLQAQHHNLADKAVQLDLLSNGIFGEGELPTFKDKIKDIDQFPLRAHSIEIFQGNV